MVEQLFLVCGSALESCVHVKLCISNIIDGNQNHKQRMMECELKTNKICLEQTNADYVCFEIL